MMLKSILYLCFKLFILYIKYSQYHVQGQDCGGEFTIAMVQTTFGTLMATISLSHLESQFVDALIS